MEQTTKNTESYRGKFFRNRSEDPGHRRQRVSGKAMPYFCIPVSFFLVELYGFYTLADSAAMDRYWPLAFGALWAIILGGVIRLLPSKVGRIAYGGIYLAAVIYSVGQTGYYQLFSQMMWLSDFRYASEGSDYFEVIFSYPLEWWLGTAAIIGLGILILLWFPKWKMAVLPNVAALLLAVVAALGAFRLPETFFVHDEEISNATTDYGRAKSAEAAYHNMFNTYRLYQMCGLYQTAAKDIYANLLYPLTPSYGQAQKKAMGEILEYMERNGRLNPGPNEMTGVLADKNVVLVLMESMDDWMVGEHTPTISRLMEEGIRFTNFYTPPYGGIRTFNTEFCMNTGGFLSSAGGYAFDYVTNSFSQSLASRMTREKGYSSKVFHYNTPDYYSRGVFSPAMGYEKYVWYRDYLSGSDEEIRSQLWDDSLLFDNQALCDAFFEKAPFCNFIITRSAHLMYQYNEIIGWWGLKRYPEYRTLTDHEELNCAYVKAKLVDDMFERLLEELEVRGMLENTVIIGVTDHYTYGFKDVETLLDVSAVEDEIWLERTPCFIWSADLAPMEVKKTLNTSDLLPTVMNLLGMEATYPYIGNDAFQDGYLGFVPFPDGSWISGEVAWDAGKQQMLYRDLAYAPATEEFCNTVHSKVQEFVRINNLILETDFYKNYKP